jgi:hypothetical protein
MTTRRTRHRMRETGDRARGYLGEYQSFPPGYGMAQPPSYQYPLPQPDHPRASWHVEKGISISLIVFLVIQTISIVWFAAQLTGQVKQNTADIALMQQENKDRDKQRAEMLSDLSSINQELRDMREIMIQSAGRPTQLVMPATSSGAPPTINIEASPRSPAQGQLNSEPGKPQ